MAVTRVIKLLWIAFVKRQKNRGKHIAVMLDTKGPEIRSGFFANNAKSISLVKGESIILTTDYSFKGDSSKMACSYASLATSVTPGQSILVADGSLVLQVASIDVTAGDVTCKIMNNAKIGERKNMNLPGVIVDMPTLTDKDIDDITNWGIPNDIDFIAASFVRKAQDVCKIKEILGEKGQGIKIICKIENLEGMQNFSEIVRETDGIMVARGDLGMEIPPEKVFLAQKMMIRECNLAGKPVVTATQMLESMIDSPRPTRAECSDVANAVMDGTDCVMLSGETANGPYFEEAISVMARTCVEAESMFNFNSLYQAIRNSTLLKYQMMSNSESIASSAVKTCHDVNGVVIVVLSESGSTARLIAKYRPNAPIIVVTPSLRVAKQCNGVLKGCTALVVNNVAPTTADLPVFQEKITKLAKDLTGCKNGDRYVMVCGNILGYTESTTNQIKVQEIAMVYADNWICQSRAHRMLPPFLTSMRSQDAVFPADYLKDELEQAGSFSEES
jgi:pyruvate kinase